MLRFTLTKGGKGFFEETDSEKAAQHEVLLSDLRRQFGEEYGFDTIVGGGKIGCRFFTHDSPSSGMGQSIFLFVTVEGLELNVVSLEMVGTEEHLSDEEVDAVLAVDLPEFAS